MENEMDPLEWVKLVKDVGVAVTVLAVVYWSLRGVCIWFGQQIIIPARDRIIGRLEKFFDKTEETMDTLVVNVERVSDQLGLQTASLTRIEQQSCGMPVLARKPDTQIRPV